MAGATDNLLPAAARKHAAANTFEKLISMMCITIPNMTLEQAKQSNTESQLSEPLCIFLFNINNTDQQLEIKQFPLETNNLLQGNRRIRNYSIEKRTAVKGEAAFRISFPWRTLL